MISKAISGVSAALLTPRTEDGNIDIAALKRQCSFLMAAGITSFAINGATGEFCLTTPEQLRVVLRAVREESQGQAKMLCGIGAASSRISIELAAIAEQEGAQGLLLPMPYFFPYLQEDLDLYCRKVAARTSLPILLYNLPQFTSGLEKETVCTLITDVPNIVGIKDSSGSLDILRHLSTHMVDVCRIVGNDSVLSAALTEGVCDGVISGVATVLPELILSLYDSAQRNEYADLEYSSQLLSELIVQLDTFPTPWGLKWLSEARGILAVSFAQPVTSHRIAQSQQMVAWFNEWFPSLSKRPSASQKELTAGWEPKTANSTLGGSECSSVKHLSV